MIERIEVEMKQLIFRTSAMILLLTGLFAAQCFCLQIEPHHKFAPLSAWKKIDDFSLMAEFLRTELYFGMNKPDGEISEEEFKEFLDKIITPELPDGLTVLSGIGQFKDSQDRIVQEKSKVIILLYPKKIRKEANLKIERIRESYKKRFQQESVLRVDTASLVRISF